MKQRQITSCRRCKRVLFVNYLGYCTSCDKRVRIYGAVWAPMRPWQRSIAGVR
jgi:ribosomal protein L37E